MTINRAQRRAIERAISKGQLTLVKEEPAMYSHPNDPRLLFRKPRPSLAVRLFVAAAVVGAGSGLVYLLSNYL